MTVSAVEFLNHFHTPTWAADGICAQTDPEIFFPGQGDSVREPKSICARCDVREQCLAYALERGEQFGIWGGLTERERRKLRRPAGRPTVCELDGCEEPLVQTPRGLRRFCTPDHAKQARTASPKTA